MCVCSLAWRLVQGHVSLINSPIGWKGFFHTFKPFLSVTPLLSFVIKKLYIFFIEKKHEYWVWTTIHKLTFGNLCPKNRWPRKSHIFQKTKTNKSKEKISAKPKKKKNKKKKKTPTPPPPPKKKNQTKKNPNVLFTTCSYYMVTVHNTKATAIVHMNYIRNKKRFCACCRITYEVEIYCFK